MNALLFKAETKHGGTAGTIQIPEDFRDATFFERTESNDLISAQGYKILTEEELAYRALENMWLQIQNLSTVREYMTAKQIRKYISSRTIRLPITIHMAASGSLFLKTDKRSF